MKPIPNYPDYFADEDGNIYSMKPPCGGGKRPSMPRKLHPYRSRDRFVVNLKVGGKQRLRFVHVLILETFVSPRPEGLLACHGIKGSLVNALDNLYWATRSQNNGIDKKRDGTMNYVGEKNGRHKLNELQVRIIRRAYSRYGKNGLNSWQLSDIFKVSRPAISSILNSYNWKHLLGDKHAIS